MCCFCPNHLPRGSRDLECAACRRVIRRSLARMARGVFPRPADRVHAASMMRPCADDAAHEWIAHSAWAVHASGPVMTERQFASARAVLDAPH